MTIPRVPNKGSWPKGDPRATAAGKKGGMVMRARKSDDWYRGYKSGFAAGRRLAKIEKASAA